MLKIGVLWRAEWDPVVEGRPVAENSRLHRVFAALTALGVDVEPVVYADEQAEQVRHQLLGLDGVLVWVNPIEQGLDRSQLDPLLRQVSSAGVWVSAHPEVILKLGTKEVLFRTRELSWGTDTHLYRTLDELREQLPPRLAAGGPRVLKQYRGIGGNGVWKVELADASAGTVVDLETAVRVRHAKRDGGEEQLRLSEFVHRCEQYFAGPGRMIDQPFQERLAEGMIRVYLTHDRVVGFAHQHPRGLLTAPPERGEPNPFEGPAAAAFQVLKERMESEWVPALQELLEIDTTALPVIWDADFLYGPKTEDGDDSYILCEINVSSTFAFPEQALETVAQAAVACVRASKSS
ncbi:MAG: Cj0069 family protein [Gaiellaceae bacterium]